MTAKVTEETIYQAYCVECEWDGWQHDNQGSAQQDAEEHDREEHS